jgi:hypothetical protein
MPGFFVLYYNIVICHSERNEESGASMSALLFNRQTYSLSPKVTVFYLTTKD